MSLELSLIQLIKYLDFKGSVSVFAKAASFVYLLAFQICLKLAVDWALIFLPENFKLIQLLNS